MDVTPAQVEELAARAVEYVRRAVGVPLEYDSDTLPLLDHYLNGVATDEPAALELVVMTSGAYFGEVVRRHLGGRWDRLAEPLRDWRVVLPTGVEFSPAGMVAAAIARDDVDDFDCRLDAPARMRPYLNEALARMGEVTDDEYYSLCGRLDTLEHLHEVLVAVAAKLLGDPDGTEGDDDEGGEGDEPPAGDPAN